MIRRTYQPWQCKKPKKQANRSQRIQSVDLASLWDNLRILPPDRELKDEYQIDDNEFDLFRRYKVENCYERVKNKGL